MAQAEPSNIVSTSSSGGEDGGGAAREAQWSGGGEELVTAAEGGGTAYATAGMSDEDIARGIQTSREQGTWSEWRQRGDGAAGQRGGGADAVVWEQLKRSDPETFRDFREGQLKLGRVIAEGGQAQIYEASSDEFYVELVAKVFKMEGFSLAELQLEWPRRRAELFSDLDANEDNHDGLGRVVFGDWLVYCSLILCATVLEDGRFVFLMRRYWGDLRTLINLRLKDNNSQGPPFSPDQALWLMLYIASGIKQLHDVGVLHRDLKAANVLINAGYGDDPRYGNIYTCIVADYESAMLVQGTGFWRAPEVLEELMKQPRDRKNDIWTEKVDAYSYAMTCYEVLTGHIPFFGYVGKEDQKRVIGGERPHLPDYIDSSVRDLVERCWEKDPSKRPLFEAIEGEIKSIRSRG